MKYNSTNLSTISRRMTQVTKLILSIPFLLVKISDVAFVESISECRLLSKDSQTIVKHGN